MAPDGIAEQWEVTSDLWPRWNSFGACATKANDTYWINQGTEAPVGAYAQCVADERLVGEPEMTQRECIDCMDVALLWQINKTASKAYVCGATCHSQELIPDGTSEVDGAPLSKLCSDCVANEDVWDGWGCTNWQAEPA